ncbi:hypothetical protein [Magnetospirillum sp. UT-4]|uniref:hypothetical protein n=1 Tax=Magnetospirillum sp. UT-4 TaxID=2681467 RepID=UPI00137E06CB|nr:hypothetical protein [Magnetospirillum sp. UT-4]CAA7618674.1 hypothetical protein MTBUT4_30145 [Magnetospirillum sp. UT-4]
MATLLLAAHDPGGARVLLAAAPELRRRGHALAFLPAGPAAAIWASEALVAEAGSADLLLTGTSFHSGFEKALWRWAAERGMPSLALLDAWTNLDIRFDDGPPDCIGAIDHGQRAELVSRPWCDCRVSVTGQAHLQAVAAGLASRRTGRRNQPPLLVYFSEPVSLDYPGAASPGYDQVSVLRAVAAALPPCRLVVRPHPRDDVEAWRAALPPGVELGGDTETLLAEADAVVGMHTMVLIEAALGGIPVLAVQPGRTRRINPVIEEAAAIPVVTAPDDLAPALARLLSGAPPAPCPLAAAVAGSDRKVADAVAMLTPL